MTARAAARQPRTEADEQSADEHPGQLAGMAQRRAPGRSIPSAHVGRPAAAKYRGEKPPSDETRRAREVATADRTSRRCALKYGSGSDQAADVFEAGRDAEPTVGDEQQRERDARRSRCPPAPSEGAAGREE